MTIQEKFKAEDNSTFFYIASTYVETGELTRFVFSSDVELDEGSEISKENPIKLSNLQTLCTLANKVYEGGVYNPNTFGCFSEAMKLQAIDHISGYIAEDELEYGLN